MSIKAIADELRVLGETDLADRVDEVTAKGTLQDKPIEITVTLEGTVSRDITRDDGERVVDIDWNKGIEQEIAEAIGKKLKLEGIPRVGGSACMLVNCAGFKARR